MFDSDEKITLDKETFKVLSSDSRIKILKYLMKRRMTLSELSKVLDMKGSSVKEHLDSLVTAELIKKIDDGHKWKYYQLTRKGKDIVNPVEKKVYIVLGLAIIGCVYSVYSMIGKQANNLLTTRAMGKTESMVLEDSFVGSGAGESAILPMAQTSSPGFSLPLLEINLLIFCSAIIVLSMFYFYRKR